MSIDTTDEATDLAVNTDLIDILSYSSFMRTTSIPTDPLAHTQNQYIIKTSLQGTVFNIKKKKKY